MALYVKHIAYLYLPLRAVSLFLRIKTFKVALYVKHIADLYIPLRAVSLFLRIKTVRALFAIMINLDICC